MQVTIFSQSGEVNSPTQLNTLNTVLYNLGPDNRYRVFSYHKLTGMPEVLSIPSYCITEQIEKEGQSIWILP